MLEHLVELEFKKAGAQATDELKAEIAKQKKAVAEAKPEFITVCVEKTAKERVACALAAKDLEAVEEAIHQDGGTAAIKDYAPRMGLDLANLPFPAEPKAKAYGVQREPFAR